MNEKILFLEQVDPSVFCGVNNSNIKLLKDLYPKLRIIARGNVIKVLGEEPDIARIEQLIKQLQVY